MRPVPQLDCMGCGVACVGYLLREPEIPRHAYNKASEAFADFDLRRCGAGFLPKMMLAALEQLNFGGISYKRRSSDFPDPSLPDGTIIYVERYRGDEARHYVVKEGHQFVDPMDIAVTSRRADATAWKGPQKRGKRREWPKQWRMLGYILNVKPGVT
jgi:hypothetical protein